jgi:hypothetical protein
MAILGSVQEFTEMATERPKQLNVRLEDEYWDLLERLTPVISADVGVKMNNADVVRLGLKCLEKRYLDSSEPRKVKGK